MSPSEQIIYEVTNGAVPPLYEPRNLERVVLSQNGWPNQDGFSSDRRGALIWAHREGGVTMLGFHLCGVSLQYVHRPHNGSASVLFKAIGEPEYIDPVVNRFRVLEETFVDLPVMKKARA